MVYKDIGEEMLEHAFEGELFAHIGEIFNLTTTIIGKRKIMYF